MKLVSLLLFVLTTPAVAQSPIATDGSLGAAVDIGEGIDSLGQHADYLIGAELGALRGDNLFHSFARFGIPTDQTATFDGPTSVRNVIARVTGGQVSSIDGWLRSTMPLADVWLLNPSGIVFGEHAHLDVPGSFHAATADFLDFEPGGERFYAKVQLTSVLSAAAPSAFGFLPETIAGGPIEVNGSALSVLEGKTLELAGGDIMLTSADLLANSGTILLRGGKIDILGESHVLAENVDSPTPGRIDADASDSLLVDNSLLSVNTSGTGDAGTIRIASPVVTFQNGPGLHSTSIPQPALAGASAQTTSAGRGGEIYINTESLTLSHGVTVDSTAVGSETAVARGDAGKVVIDAHSVEVSDRSYIGAGGWGSTGRGGSIEIDLGDAGSLVVDGATDDAQITGPRYAWIITNSNGIPGTIEIRSGSVTVRNGGGINSSCNPGCTPNPSGDVGNIAVDANSIVLEKGGHIVAGTSGAGDAGTITIETGSLLVTDGGNVGAGTNGRTDENGALVASSGNGGVIRIHADSVRVESAGTYIFNSAIGTDSRNSTGNAGDIYLTVGTLEVDHQGVIGASSVYLIENRGRGGDGGTIEVEATDWIRVHDGEPFDLARLLNDDDFMTGIFSGTVLGGDGGTIRLRAPEITASDGGIISSATIGGRTGGDVDLSGGTIRFLNGGLASTSSLLTDARGGELSLVATDSIEVSGRHPANGVPSYVSSGTTNAGAAGDVTLRAPHIVIDGGAITSGSAPLTIGASGGAGGTILIEAARDLLVRNGGVVDATTLSAGEAGDIEIRAGELIRVEGAGSSISSRTAASGAGGDVTLTAPRIEIVDGARVSARSEAGFGELAPLFAGLREGPVFYRLAPVPAVATGNAGSTTLIARDLVHLDGGTISTAVGSAAGGNITIDPTFVILEHGSQIVATAGETGTGGHIRINADHFFAFPGSVVSAASGNPDLSGTVEIATPDVDLAGSLTALPATFLDAASQMRQRCAARRGGERAGSFAVHGAGGIPAEPDGWLPAPVFSEADAIASLPGPMHASAACP